MAPKVFITGATGYIGGDALYALHEAHPEYEYSALVRDSDKGAPVAAAFPKIRLVYGTLDDASILEEEAARADIVLHTADSSDHEGSARAFAKGMSAGHSKERPGYWLHTSGTGILCWKDMETKTYGEPPYMPPYDDLEGVDKLTGLPDDAWHRNIDELVLNAGTAQPDVVKTAIVCPPTIYGPGRGPGNQRSRQVYELAKTTLKNGQPPQLGRGLTEWDNVHVHDLSSLFVSLAEAAAAKKESPELWGPRGYFLAEHGHHVWGELSKEVGQAAYKAGYISIPEPKPMSIDEAMEQVGMQAMTWGLNSKGHARRAAKYLGWKPTGKTLSQEIPDIVEGEAKSLGLKVGHAKKAAGMA